MAPRSVRVYWGNYKGRLTCNFNWPGVIDFRSVVVVTAAEYHPWPVDAGTIPGWYEPSPVPDDFRRFVGAADMVVSDISPHGPEGTDPGGVTFVVNVNWRDPIPVTTDIIVFDPVVDRIFA